MKIEKDYRQVNSIEIAENILWEHIKNGKLNGKKFIRKHKVDDFVVEFYCQQEKLAIIFKSSQIKNSILAEYYRRNEIHLKRYGIRLLKFEPKDILYNLKSVLSEINSNIYSY